MAPDMPGEQHSNVVKYEEEFIQSSQGVKLFTCRWVPADRQAKALICLCHGYGIECSIFMKDTGVRFAKAGYAVFGIDYEGHGKSAGTQCYIKSFDDLVADCATFFRSVAESVEYREKARFLYGESMGGAVALLIHRKQPNYWSGAVLVAPMCKITEELIPPPLVLSILWTLTAIIPTWKLMPTQDITDVGIKDPDKRMELRANPYLYRGRPRLKTAFELLMTSLDIEKRLDEVMLPFLIVHGEDDRVTDPSVSKLLYASAKSLDKTLKLYPNMWHGLTYGEPPEHIELVFSDIIAWLGKRSAAVCPEEPPLETSRNSLP
uniref:Serine aminopeptidase S33 domain-containing protein n=1 Tax=Picea sitchensis TaxID=3332 RepID=B8LL19_PICSI|nr:unknown [Picea sitchensis]